MIEKELSDFCDEYLDPYAEEPFNELCSAVAGCEELNLMRGKPEVWAAGIAYVFCRMNFLLDGGSPAGLSLTRDEFFSFFEECNRSTVTQRATKIERAVECGPLNDEESRRLEEQLRGRERQAEEKTRRERLEVLEKKREEERKIQPELFDF